MSPADRALGERWVEEVWNMEPTGSQLAVTGISIIGIANGQITEVWQNWDMLGKAAAATYIAAS